MVTASINPHRQSDSDVGDRVTDDRLHNGCSYVPASSNRVPEVAVLTIPKEYFNLVSIAGGLLICVKTRGIHTVGKTYEVVHCQVRANETYSGAKRQFSDRNRDVLMNDPSPHKWWSTLKSAVFGASSSVPPLVSEGGGLVCESVGKTDLLSTILTASNPGRLLICRSNIIRLLVLPPLRSGRVW